MAAVLGFPQSRSVTADGTIPLIGIRTEKLYPSWPVVAASGAVAGARCGVALPLRRGVRSTAHPERDAARRVQSHNVQPTTTTRTN
jgi:hypothetical protein